MPYEDLIYLFDYIHLFILSTYFCQVVSEKIKEDFQSSMQTGGSNSIKDVMDSMGLGSMFDQVATYCYSCSESNSDS